MGQKKKIEINISVYSICIISKYIFVSIHVHVSYQCIKVLEMVDS